MKKKGNKGYTENIRHPQSTHPDPWPGIPGRSAEHETDLPTGTDREHQAGVTEAQRELERDMGEPPRE
jgi:hypothetical protein